MSQLWQNSVRGAIVMKFWSKKSQKLANANLHLFFWPNVLANCYVLKCLFLSSIHSHFDHSGGCWMEPIAAFPGLTSVATSEMLSQLTIDQSLEKGGTILLPLAVNSHAFNNWVKQQGWIDDTGDWMDNVLSFLWEWGLEGIKKSFICSLTS